MVVAMRMGGPEEYVLTADLDDCMGDWWTEGTNPVDSGGTQRGLFTKEYMAEALREGWGTFFNAWAWNRRTESDCELKAMKYYSDFDLDGEVDNDFTGTTDDFLVDCIGTPYVDADPDPLPMDDANWLLDLVNYDDEAGCESAGLALEYNRGTVYDAAKFFWVLTSDPSDPIDPDRLADVYIDMCPRAWSEEDAEWQADVEAAPKYRVTFAAEEHPDIEDQIMDAKNDYL